MRASRFCWISAVASLVMLCGCAPKNDNPGGVQKVTESPDSGGVASVPATPDSIAALIDSIPEVEQDTPRKSPRELAEERRLAQKPRTFVNIGAPDDRLPSLKNNAAFPECKELFELIRRDWGVGARPKVFQVRGDSLGVFRSRLIENAKCLRYIPQADVESLFGKPSMESANELTYFLTEACLGRGGSRARGCDCLKMELTHDKLVVNVSFSTSPSR